MTLAWQQDANAAQHPPKRVWLNEDWSRVSGHVGVNLNFQNTYFKKKHDRKPKRRTSRSWKNCKHCLMKRALVFDLMLLELRKELSQRPKCHILYACMFIYNSRCCILHPTRSYTLTSPFPLEGKEPSSIGVLSSAQRVFLVCGGIRNLDTWLKYYANIICWKLNC